MGNWKTPGTRLMDNAYMYDKSGNIHTGEALMLALLLVAKGKTSRGQQEMLQVGKLMKDHNLPKEKHVRRRTNKS